MNSTTVFIATLVSQDSQETTDKALNAIKTCLQELKVSPGLASLTDGGYQLTFISKSPAMSEKILSAFADLDTSPKISMMPALSPPEINSDETFVQSIRSRQHMQHIVAMTKTQSTFSFDFLVLTLVASTLAAFGLSTNNPVIVVASMLVSPIMGPVLALTFGTIINDRAMVRNAVIVEILSLAICIAVGFIIGIAMVPFAERFDWPTEEMLQRSEAAGLLIGALIALPSGIGVALSVLGNNSSSLIGVAISASLLPPAVDAGLLWAYGIYGDHPDWTRGEIFFLGGISFMLTALNIVIIYAASLLMFWVKEVAPIKGKPVLFNQITETRQQNQKDADDPLEIGTNKIDESPLIGMHQKSMGDVLGFTTSILPEQISTPTKGRGVSAYHNQEFNE